MRQRAVTTPVHDAGMQSGMWVEFQLSAAGVADTMSVKLREFGERSVASVQVGPNTHSGLGANAREALVAALAPLGARTTVAVMAAPDMFGASVAVLAARPAG